MTTSSHNAIVGIEGSGIGGECERRKMAKGQGVGTRNLRNVISVDPCGGLSNSLAYSEREMTKVPSQGMKYFEKEYGIS